jgi:anti-anti-sigma factor
MSTPPTLAGTRQWGRLAPDASFGPSDHGCWGYATDAERAARASAWLVDGLRIGQRALYVYDGPAAAGIADLAAIEPDPFVRRGALQVVSSTDVYDVSAPVDAGSQLGLYAAAVDQARADGYCGLRVAADISPLVADPARRPAHVHWEEVADRYMTTHPLAPLCLYDTRRITGIDAIVSVHPLRGPERTMFGLFGVSPRGAALEGEIDAMADETLTALLQGLPQDDTEIDVSQLGFVDGRGAWRLHDEMQARRANGQHLTLVAASPLVRRVWSLCGFDPALLAAGTGR